MKKSELRQIIREEIKKQALNEDKISRGIFKGYEKYKNGVLIPLNIKNIPKDFKSSMTPKLTVGVGISIQNELPKFTDKYFDIEFINNKFYLLLTSNGKLAIKVRLEKDSDYLNKTIKTFNKYVSKKIKDWN